jgi:hypothetical protein
MENKNCAICNKVLKNWHPQWQGRHFRCVEINSHNRQVCTTLCDVLQVAGWFGFALLIAKFLR